MKLPVVSREAGGMPPPAVMPPGPDIRGEQEEALWQDLPLPHPGLPRHYVRQALDAVLLFEPDIVFLFGSVARGQDTVHSDIDLLVAVEGLPLVSWRDWSFAMSEAARHFCPFEADVKITDVEDLERRRHVVTSPCMWVRREGVLLYDQGRRVAPPDQLSETPADHLAFPDPAPNTGSAAVT